MGKNALSYQWLITFLMWGLALCSNKKQPTKYLSMEWISFKKTENLLEKKIHNKDTPHPFKP